MARTLDLSFGVLDAAAARWAAWTGRKGGGALGGAEAATAGGSPGETAALQIELNGRSSVPLNSTAIFGGS